MKNFKKVFKKEKSIIGMIHVGLRGCGGDDAARFEVTATNSNGQRVDCLVCADWPFKGATIRYK